MTEPDGRNWDELVHAALERVAWKVVERAEQTGTPVIGWEDGKVVERSPQSVRERLFARQKDGDVEVPAESDAEIE
jgi:hypothetical protein